MMLLISMQACKVDRTLKDVTEEQIVEAARSGDAESFGMLYERYYATVVWLAYSILLDRDLAEDTAQQTFVKACEKLADLRRADRFGPWLTAICRNEAQQLIRQRLRRVPQETPEPQHVGQDSLIEEDHRMVRAAIDRLEPMYREIIVLHYFHGMDYRQIARALGIAGHTVRGRLFRARRQIERALKSTGFEG